MTISIIPCGTGYSEAADYMPICLFIVDSAPLKEWRKENYANGLPLLSSYNRHISMAITTQTADNVARTKSPRRTWYRERASSRKTHVTYRYFKYLLTT
jgi:hypothetical protein